MKIAIIVPNYNGEGFINDLINDLINGFKGIPVIVIDDFSNDKSVELLQSCDKSRVKLIKRSSNGGFAASVNTGLKYCAQNKIDFVLISNSDIRMSKQNCKDISMQFQNFFNPKIGVLGFLESGLNNYRDNENISGFLFALRVNLIDTVGYLDETFFMYGEEQDFFRRVLDSEFEIVQTGLEIYHKCEMSSQSNSSRNAWLSIRNSIYLEVKRNNFFLIFKKIFVLFLIINRVRRPKDKNDPSLIRITRTGPLKGNFHLIKAILWNVGNKYRSKSAKKSKFN
jgi:GT2 family glycosyltransferase